MPPMVSMDQKDMTNWGQLEAEYQCDVLLDTQLSMALAKLTVRNSSQKVQVQPNQMVCLSGYWVVFLNISAAANLGIRAI